MTELRAGLTRVFADTPVREGWIEAEAGWSRMGGPFGRLEALVRPTERLGLFGYGMIDRAGPQAGVGARYVFEW